MSAFRLTANNRSSLHIAAGDTECSLDSDTVGLEVRLLLLQRFLHNPPGGEAD